MEERGAGSLLDILARSCPALGITLLFFFFLMRCQVKEHLNRNDRCQHFLRFENGLRVGSAIDQVHRGGGGSAGPQVTPPLGQLLCRAPSHLLFVPIPEDRGRSAPAPEGLALLWL